MRIMKRDLGVSKATFFACLLLCASPATISQAGTDGAPIPQTPAGVDGLRSTVVFGQLRIELPFSMVSQIVVLPLGFPNLAIGANNASNADLIHFGIMDKFGKTLELYKQKGVIGEAAAENAEKFFDTLSDAVQNKLASGNKLRKLMDVEDAISTTKRDLPTLKLYRFDLASAKHLYVFPKGNSDVYYIKGAMTEEQASALVSGLAHTR